MKYPRTFNLMAAILAGMFLLLVLQTFGLLDGWSQVTPVGGKGTPIAPGTGVTFTTNSGVVTINATPGGFTADANQFGLNGAGANVIKSGATLTNTALQGVVSGTGVSTNSTATTIALRDPNGSLVANHLIFSIMETHAVNPGYYNLTGNVGGDSVWHWFSDNGTGSGSGFCIPDFGTNAVGPFGEAGTALSKNTDGSTNYWYTEFATAFLVAGNDAAHSVWPSWATWVVQANDGVYGAAIVNAATGGHGNEAYELFDVNGDVQFPLHQSDITKLIPGDTGYSNLMWLHSSTQTLDVLGRENVGRNTANGTGDLQLLPATSTSGPQLGINNGSHQYAIQVGKSGDPFPNMLTIIGNNGTFGHPNLIVGDSGTTSLGGNLTNAPFFGSDIGTSGSFHGSGTNTFNGANFMNNVTGTTQTNTGVISSGALVVVGATDLAAGITTKVASKSTSYTLLTTDYKIEFTGSSGQTMTLPTAVSATGQDYIIKNAGSSTLTVGTTSSQTIFTTSAVTTVTLQIGDVLVVTSDGSNWAAF